MKQAALPTTEVLATLAGRLVPDKAKLLIEGVRSLDGKYNDNGIGWLGHIDWFKVGDAIGMHSTRADRTAEKFHRMGLQESRNNYDGWILPLGVALAHFLDPTIVPYQAPSPA